MKNIVISIFMLFNCIQSVFSKSKNILSSDYRVDVLHRVDAELCTEPGREGEGGRGWCSRQPPSRCLRRHRLPTARLGVPGGGRRRIDGGNRRKVGLKDTCPAVTENQKNRFFGFVKIIYFFLDKKS